MIGWIGVGGGVWVFIGVVLQKGMKSETNMWAIGWAGVGWRPSVDVKGAAGLYFHRANSPWDNNGVQHHFCAASSRRWSRGRKRDGRDWKKW